MLRSPRDVFDIFAFKNFRDTYISPVYRPISKIFYDTVGHELFMSMMNCWNHPMLQNC